MNRFLSCAATVLAVASPARAQLQTVQIQPSADAAIYAESGSVANGAGQNLFLGTNSMGNARRSLVRFDVAASIPAGSIVVSAFLYVTVNQAASAGQMDVRRVLASWSEGPSDPSGAEGQGTAAGAGDSTWTMRDFGASLPWTTPGGDLALVPSFVGGLPASGNSFIGIAPQGIADLQSWLDQPAQNFGWCFVEESSPGTTHRLDSRQSTNGAARPYIQVDYFPPLGQPLAYCIPTPNSAGPGAVIGWSGSTSVSANQFVLSASGLPPSTTGTFFFGRGSGVFGSFGDGTMCVPSPLHRIGIQTVGANGSVSRALDLATFPGTLLAPMTTASFQFYYRDAAAGGAGFNLSTAIWSPFFP